MILEIADLVHHLLINGETSGCIDDYHIVAVGLSLLDGMVGDTEHILVLWLAVCGTPTCSPTTWSCWIAAGR